MWVWFQLRLTPKGDYTKKNITAIFVLSAHIVTNYGAQIPEISDTRMGKYSDFLCQTCR